MFPSWMLYHGVREWRAECQTDNDNGLVPGRVCLTYFTHKGTHNYYMEKMDLKINQKKRKPQEAGILSDSDLQNKYACSSARGITAHIPQASSSPTKVKKARYKRRGGRKGKHGNWIGSDVDRD